MKPIGQLVRVADLGASQRDEMFALMEAYYECADRATFDADLDEKTWVIQINDDETQRLLGFSTQMLLRVPVAGRWVRALFSGDTIVDRDARSERGLFQVSGWFVRSLIEAYPGEELYWFLISKGYKTYRFMPLFFHDFYPRHDRATPPRFSAVIDALGAYKFPGAYDRAAGIVRAGTDSCRLRAGVAEVTADRLSDPHVRYFVERNPRHAEGDELCCIAPLTLANFTPIALRAMGANRPRSSRYREPGSGALAMPRSLRREERLGVGEVVGRLLQIVAQQETTKYCAHCNKQVRAVRPGTSRLRQLGLTIVTLGLWSIAWIVDARRRPGWRCATCDRRVG